MPKVHLLDLSGPLQAFYEARNLCDCPLDITSTSFDEQVYSEQRLGVGPLTAPQQLEINEDTLICIPGVDFNSFQNGELQAEIERITPWLNEACQGGAHIASICTGALILAEAGLLDHRRCTCHWKCLDFIKSNYPKAKLQSGSIYTEDRRIYTSAGMTTGIDLTLYLLESWYRAFVAARVAQELVVPFRREGGTSQEHLYNQMQGGFHPAVFKAQEILLNQPEANPSQEQLAAQVHLSPRHLARLFKKYTGKTIYQFRLELARRCGYRTVRQFRRVWKGRYGVAPSISPKPVKLL